jgi:uncharacterized protein (DUF849 family)
MPINSDIIINFAPTGAVASKKENSHLPVSINEIVDEVLYAVEIGITSVHLHVRDEENGKSTLAPELYAYVIEKLRKFAPSLVICTSLSGRYHKEIEQRCAPLLLDKDVRPDMASLTLGSMNFLKSANINTPETVITLAQKMIEQGIKPELEVFDTGMVHYAKYLIEKKLLQPPYYFNLIFGNVATAAATLSDIGHLTQMLPQDSLVSFGGIGKTQLSVNAIAIAMGHGVRVGLEDNLWGYQKNNKIPTSNAQLLYKVHELIRIHQKELMTSESFRKRLEL